MITHQLVQLVAGDTWMFSATFLDPSGNPIAFDDPSQIEWTMLNPRMQNAPLFQPGDFAVTLGAAACTVLVTVNPDVTTAIAAGSYTDWWRVEVQGAVQTLLTGPYAVTADPFVVPAQNVSKKPILLVSSKVA